MLPRDRSERSLNGQTLFRKRNQLIEKACSNFWYLASCIHHLVAGLPLRKPRGIARNTSTRRGRRNSIPNPGVINDVSRSPGVGLLRTLGGRICDSRDFPGATTSRTPRRTKDTRAYDPGRKEREARARLSRKRRPAGILGRGKHFLRDTLEIFINPGMSRRICFTGGGKRGFIPVQPATFPPRRNVI